MLELTIIIVNWNTKEDLCSCLASIRSCCDKERVTTIVVDNASKDGSAAAIAEKFPEVTLINSGGNLGFGKANNRGLADAATPYVLFLNPDTVVQGNAVGAMVDFLNAHPEVTIVQCKQMSPDHHTQTLCLQWEFTPFTMLLELGFANDQLASRYRNVFSYHDPEVSGFLKTVAGGCMMVRKTMLDAIGGFDERFFMYAEDGDLCRRVRSAGGKIYYLADTWIMHTHGKASSKAGSEFAGLMSLESYEKLMGKYYGIGGRVFLRAGVAIIGIGKSTVFTLLNVMKNKSTPHPLHRYALMVQWALLFRKAKVVD